MSHPLTLLLPAPLDPRALDALPLHPLDVPTGTPAPPHSSLELLLPADVVDVADTAGVERVDLLATARWLLAVGGQVTIALGVALQTRAGLGVVGWDAVHAGLGELLSVGPGRAAQVVALLLVLLGRVLGYRPTAMVVVAASCFGLLLDAFFAVLPVLSGTGRWAGLVAGAALTAFGVAAYLRAGVGESAHDIPLALARARGVRIGMAANVNLAATTVLGALLGVRPGLGSLVTMAVMAAGIPAAAGALDRIADRLRPLVPRPAVA